MCWRLAKQLANEHKLVVRLWIDDLNSFTRLCPEANSALLKQTCHSVEVCLWCSDFLDVHPADIVIEAFACQLPQIYLEAMAHQQSQPVWINLEYLSAEDWVHDYHQLPSPHPTLTLTKYFFFPGFAKATGGLLLEHDLLARRDAFQNDAEQQRVFWQSLDMTIPTGDTLKISLFAYENAALASLFDAWVASSQPVLCLVPEGRILTQIGEYFSQAVWTGNEYSRGNLRVRVLPFVAQENYDLLLWACDVNFVRGEDSCVRAQWVGCPFIWQIYPQHDQVHFDKLNAFLGLYTAQMSQSVQFTVIDLWTAWNKEADANQMWAAFIANRDELSRHAQVWAGELAKNNLALNLLDFCQKIGRIRAFKIEG